MRAAGVGQRWQRRVCEQSSELNTADQLERVCRVTAVSPRPSTAPGQLTHQPNDPAF